MPAWGIWAGGGAGGVFAAGGGLRPATPPSDTAARQMVLPPSHASTKRWLLMYDNVDQLMAAQLRPY
ncbi:MAG: hypothetical protein KC423_11010 [Anaerolineales bacterium]|nr:hypothetical protein [Anaerolineales bacterium]